jgi:alpha-N-arabinofuranosidase
MKRRDFLTKTLAVAALGVAPRVAKSSDSHIEVLIDEPIETIDPKLHGHFIEHIGGGHLRRPVGG